MTWSHVAAAVFSVALVAYSVSAGGSGHMPVQAGLIAAGALMVYETLADLLDRVRWPR